MWHRNDETLTVEKMEFVTWICLYNLLSCKVGVHVHYDIHDTTQH